MAGLVPQGVAAAFGFFTRTSRIASQRLLLASRTSTLLIVLILLSAPTELALHSYTATCHIAALSSFRFLPSSDVQGPPRTQLKIILQLENLQVARSHQQQQVTLLACQSISSLTVCPADIMSDNKRKAVSQVNPRPSKKPQLAGKVKVKHLSSDTVAKPVIGKFNLLKTEHRC